MAKKINSEFKISNDSSFSITMGTSNKKNPEVIQKRLRTIMMGPANAGLTATQTSNSDLRSIMENFLNGGMNTEFGTVIKK